LKLKWLLDLSLTVVDGFDHLGLVSFSGAHMGAHHQIALSPPYQEGWRQFVLVFVFQTFNITPTTTQWRHSKIPQKLPFFVFTQNSGGMGSARPTTENRLLPPQPNGGIPRFRKTPHFFFFF